MDSTLKTNETEVARSSVPAAAHLGPTRHRLVARLSLIGLAAGCLIAMYGNSHLTGEPMAPPWTAESIRNIGLTVMLISLVPLLISRRWSAEGPHRAGTAGSPEQPGLARQGESAEPIGVPIVRESAGAGTQASDEGRVAARGVWGVCAVAAISALVPPLLPGLLPAVYHFLMVLPAFVMTTTLILFGPIRLRVFCLGAVVPQFVALVLVGISVVSGFVLPGVGGPYAIPTRDLFFDAEIDRLLNVLDFHSSHTRLLFSVLWLLVPLAGAVSTASFRCVVTRERTAARHAGHFPA